MSRTILDLWKRISLKKCPNCGFDRIERDHKYCMMCGTKLKTGRRENKHEGNF